MHDWRAGRQTTCKLTETGARPARFLGVTASAGFVLTEASWLARKLELRREVGARLKPDAEASACSRYHDETLNREEDLGFPVL